MAITDNWGYVKRMIAGSLGLLTLPSAASAESKLLSLIDGTDRVFFIQLLQDIFGVWRVEGM